MTRIRFPFDFPSESFQADLCLFFRMIDAPDTDLQAKSDTYRTDGTLIADPRLVAFLRAMARAIMNDAKDVTIIRIVDETLTPFQRYMIRSFDIPAEALGARCVYMERGNFKTLLHNECGDRPVDHDFHVLDTTQIVLHDTADAITVEQQTLYTLVRQNVLIDGFDLDALLAAHADL